MKGSGVGARTAFNIINAKGARHLLALIFNNDREGFAKLKGIGPKKAKELTELLFKEPEKPIIRATVAPLNADAVEALKALGHNATDAKAKVRQAMTKSSGATTEDIIKIALREKL